MPTEANTRPDLMTDKAPRPRRWIPLSLRMFVALLALLVIASTFWIAFGVWLPWHREQAVIRQIERWGGHVATEACVPSWCEFFLGESPAQIFQRVVEVHLIGGEIQNDDLRILQSLRRLDVLDVSSTEIDDAGCARLAQFERLEQLYIDMTPVSDDGMKHLSKLKTLHVLYIHGTKVSNRGVETLREALPNLKIGISD